VWEKFAQDTEREIRASAPKEPSARARMVSERLREREARGDVPEGWRAGPAWREKDRRAARRRRLWAVIGVPVAVALAIVAMKPSLLPGDPFGTATSDERAASSPLPAETAPPTAPPSSSDPDTPTLDEPFAGSPALRYADGAAGIVLPKAAPVGSVSKDRVELALRQTKELLVGANLDPKTLRGGSPKAALAVLDPLQSDVLGRLNASLRAPDEDHDPLLMFSRFDPDEVRLVGDVVKTRGRMTFTKGEHASVSVHADYTFVYPLVRTDGSTEVTRTIVRRVLDLEIPDPARYKVTPGRLTLLSYHARHGNVACETHDGYLHPQFSSSEPTGTPPSGPTTDPYDRSQGLDTDRPGSCGTVSRT
jgi:hypothetical protein